MSTVSSHPIPGARVRNVALVGQSGAGKTTVVEALLGRTGSADAGSATTGLRAASVPWTAANGQTYRLNVLDTPGAPDFVAELDAALSVADLAVVVVDAADGVGVGTSLVWERCDAFDLPRFVFVTGEDRRRADFDRVLGQLRSTFGATLVAIEAPVGEADALEGVVDLLHGGEADRDESLVEEIVAGDEETLARYLDGETPTPTDLEAALAHEVADRTEVPVLLGSALRGIGIDRLAEYLCDVAPSPLDRSVSVIAGDRTVEITSDPGADPLLYVFKTVSDQYVGQVSYFKVLTGVVTSDTSLTEMSSGQTERLHSLLRIEGLDLSPTGRLEAGEIGAVAKLAHTESRSTLAPASTPVIVAPPDLPEPQFALSLAPASRSDADRLSEALHRLTREDPSLRVTHDAGTHRLVLEGVGDVHVESAVARLASRYGVEVATDEVEVPYRRTISASAEAEGRVKKQSGGHGQYAVVSLRVSPLEPGAGFEFVDSVVGGAIPKHYVAAVRHGVEAAMSGAEHGEPPVVDVRVECYDGKAHSVDSSEMAFRAAAAQAFREAVEAAGPTLLEPISKVTIVVPSDMQGVVLGDVSGRRGHVVENRPNGDGSQHIVAEMPMAELRRYVVDVRTMTAGQGHFHAEPAGYRPAPQRSS